MLSSWSRRWGAHAPRAGRGGAGESWTGAHELVYAGAPPGWGAKQARSGGEQWGMPHGTASTAARQGSVITTARWAPSGVTRREASAAHAPSEDRGSPESRPSGKERTRAAGPAPAGREERGGVVERTRASEGSGGVRRVVIRRRSARPDSASSSEGSQGPLPPSASILRNAAGLPGGETRQPGSAAATPLRGEGFVLGAAIFTRHGMVPLTRGPLQRSGSHRNSPGLPPYAHDREPISLASRLPGRIPGDSVTAAGPSRHGAASEPRSSVSGGGGQPDGIQSGETMIQAATTAGETGRQAGLRMIPAPLPLIEPSSQGAGTSPVPAMQDRGDGPLWQVPAPPSSSVAPSLFRAARDRRDGGKVAARGSTRAARASTMMSFAVARGPLIRSRQAAVGAAASRVESGSRSALQPLARGDIRLASDDRSADRASLGQWGGEIVARNGSGEDTPPFSPFARQGRAQPGPDLVWRTPSGPSWESRQGGLMMATAPGGIREPFGGSSRLVPYPTPGGSGGEAAQSGSFPTQTVSFPGMPASTTPQPDGGAGGGGVDMEEVAERVTRLLLRNLAVERERRGIGRWP